MPGPLSALKVIEFAGIGPAPMAGMLLADLGGHFGPRGLLSPEIGAVPWEARRVGRPVKWTCERSEAFLSDYQARDLFCTAELALDAEGNFLAMRGSNLSNVGSVPSNYGQLKKGVEIMTSLYRVPCAHFRARGVVSNTMLTRPYRSSGRPEAMYVIERLIDLAARDRWLELMMASIREQDLPQTVADYLERFLGDIATFRADFRDQYYGLVGAVGDDVDGPPLVTSGLIDPGVCHWGSRPVRFAHHRYDAPRVDLARLSPEMLRWATQRLVPKILVANQTRVIEAVVDREGAWLPGVAVPLVKEHMRHETANVVLPAEPEHLIKHLRERGGEGVRMNLNFLGEALLGDAIGEVADDIEVVADEEVGEPLLTTQIGK